MNALSDLPPREDWEPDVQGLAEIEKGGRDGYALAYGQNGTLLRERVQRARDMLRTAVLTPEERRQLQAVADQEDEANTNIRTGLTAFKETPRRVTDWTTERHPSFMAWAEQEYVVRVREAAAALEGPLRAYLEAFNEAADAYRSFEKATVAVIAARDASAQVWRADDTVRTEAQVPECPLPMNAVELIHRVMPRPLVYGQED
jgi:hypothetical protein